MATWTAAGSVPRTAGRAVRPLPLWQAAVLFAVPAAAMALAIYGLWPALTALGVRKVDGRFWVSTLVMAGLVLAAIVAFVREGHPVTWTAFAVRYRLGAPDARTWVWSLGGLLVMGVLSLAANLLLPAVWRALRFTPPEAYVEGAPALWLTLLNLTCNILGEELWWRGYILPRQELVHGRWTWLIHGVLWALFHSYKWWVVPAMLVTCLVIPYVAQRTRSTWPGILIHFGINGLGILLDVLGIL
jgi:membrane protease YdiL (CAAX protease family)